MGILDFFKKKSAANEFFVKLPEKERFTAVDLQLKGKPYVGVFNEAIMELTPKEAFGWYLSLMIHYEKSVGDEMPDNDDTIKMQDFCELLSKKLAKDESHPNALFLGRVTGNGSTQFMWYVNNPEQANNYLKHLMASNEYPFQFSYEMSFDKDWGEAHFWIDPLIDK